MTTTKPSRAHSLESGSPLGLARPTLDVEIGCRNNCRQHLIGLLCQITTTGDVDTITGSWWGKGTTLHVTTRDFDVPASTVKLLQPWPSPCCPISAAQLRDAELREHLTNTRTGKRLLAELIREQDAAPTGRYKIRQDPTFPGGTGPADPVKTANPPTGSVAGT